MTEKELVEKYVSHRRLVEKLEEELKQEKQYLESTTQELIESMTARDAMTTAKYDGIGSVSLSKPRVFASYDKAVEDVVFDFIESVERAEIIKPTIHPASLSSFVSEMLEQGKAIPECITYYIKQGVKFNSIK